MLFKLEDLKQLFIKNRGNIIDGAEINHVNTDSRAFAPQSLFIPIVGEHFNGHDYIADAIKNGAVAVIWDEKEDLPNSIPADFPVFFTADTIKGLHQLALYYRNLIDPIVIGITGSNGKTTTKDLVAAVCASAFRTHYTSGNFNNHIGMPLTILSMPQDTEVLVLEMGMDRFGEIDVLTNIACPDYGIITNIGESHIEFLGSRAGIAKAKLEIINGLNPEGKLIIDGDEPLLSEIHKDKQINIKTAGFHKQNDVQIIDTDITVEGTTFTLNNGETFHVALFGRHHAKNAAFALSIAEELNISKEKQKIALRTLKHTSMRFELLAAIHGAMIVNDSYNASPTSMKGAIEVIKQMEGFQKKILVLGDVLELGEFAEDMHRDIAQVVTEPITHLYTYGKNAAFITEEVNNRTSTVLTSHYDTKELLMQDLEKELDKNTIALFKASRVLAFETMVHELILPVENERR